MFVSLMVIVDSFSFLRALYYTGSDSCFFARILPLSDESRVSLQSLLTSHQSLWLRLAALCSLWLSLLVSLRPWREILFLVPA